HNWVTVTPFGKVIFTVHPLIAALPAVTVTVPWKPPCQAPTCAYDAVQAPPPGSAEVGPAEVGRAEEGRADEGAADEGAAVVGDAVPSRAVQWSFACTMLNFRAGQSKLDPDGGVPRLELAVDAATQAPFWLTWTPLASNT